MSKSPAKQALEILERAGYKAPRYLADAEHPLELIVADLQHCVEQEQAELEAEALELFNTLQVEIHGILGPNWVPVTEFPNFETKRKWLAVARKAREMRK